MTTSVELTRAAEFQPTACYFEAYKKFKFDLCEDALDFLEFSEILPPRYIVGKFQTSCPWLTEHYDSVFVSEAKPERISLVLTATQ